MPLPYIHRQPVEGRVDRCVPLPLDARLNACSHGRSCPSPHVPHIRDRPINVIAAFLLSSALRWSFSPFGPKIPEARPATKRIAGPGVPSLRIEDARNRIDL